MQTLYNVIIVLHLIGWAVALGGSVVSIKVGNLPHAILDGAGTALVTGLILAGMALGDVVDRDPSHVKLAVKLIIALLVVVLAVVGRRRPEGRARIFAIAISALVVVNIALAVLWH